MQFEPPLIENIKDVLPFVEDNPAFVIAEKDWYKVIDYRYMSDKMFHNAHERECRGIKFCSKTGKILARPYHKFHNLNERPDYSTENVNLKNPHVILDKLDGSMVHTCATEMGIYLMTRMGITEVAEQADKFLCANPVKFSRLFNSLPIEEYTYIFEYVGPNNKIVLDYKEEDLILTAIRHTANGTYVFHDELMKLGEVHGVTVVPAIHSGMLTCEEFANKVRESSGTEGVVIRFDTGAMVKLKCDEYVRKHRSKEIVGSPKGIVGLIIHNELDDVLPQLDEDVQKKVQEYQNTIHAWLMVEAFKIYSFVNDNKELTQKEFALKVQDEISRPLQAVVYNTRKGCNPEDEILKLIARNLSTNKRIEELFEALGLPIWTFSFFAEE